MSSIALTAAGCSGGDRSLRETVRDAVRAAPGSGARDYRALPADQAQAVAMSVAALTVGAELDSPPPGYRVVRVPDRAEGSDDLGGPTGADGAEPLDGADPLDGAGGADRHLLVLEEVPTDGQVPGHGLYVVRPDAVGAPVVQVPHPVADRSTEMLGVQLFTEVEGGVLMVAGAHRRAGGGAADVAHGSDSAFAAVDRAIVGPGTPVLQLHGFAAQEYPESYGDVVLSSGHEDPSRLVRDIAGSLREAGFDVCVYDGDRCSRLAGTRNAQGAHARAVGADFVHVEVSDAVRSEDDRIDTLVSTLADAVRARGADRDPTGSSSSEAPS